MNYRYDMGIKVRNTPFPDPSKWDYEVADLDTEAERDATGYLHRKKVATKVNYSFEWPGLGWEMLTLMLEAVDSAKFMLTAPDPRNYQRMWTGDYYVGNRDGTNLFYWPEHPETAVFTLKLKFIQY